MKSRIQNIDQKFEVDEMIAIIQALDGLIGVTENIIYGEKECNEDKPSDEEIEEFEKLLVSAKSAYSKSIEMFANAGTDLSMFAVHWLFIKATILLVALIFYSGFCSVKLGSVGVFLGCLGLTAIWDKAWSLLEKSFWSFVMSSW